MSEGQIPINKETCKTNSLSSIDNENSRESHSDVQTSQIPENDEENVDNLSSNSKVPEVSATVAAVILFCFVIGSHEEYLRKINVTICYFKVALYFVVCKLYSSSFCFLSVYFHVSMWYG